jgi:DNA-binding MarR family transcriptional regulator
MDERLLEPLGLHKKEIALYQAVLRLGETSPAELAKATGIKRTTAYSMARGLVEKGMLTEDSTRRPRIFLPASPENVLSLIDSEKKRLTEREESYKLLANELAKISAGKSYPVPVVRFIEESKLEDFLRKQVSVWDKSIIESGELTWWGFQDHTFVEQFGDWIVWYWKRFPKGVDLKLLSNRSGSEVAFGAQIKDQVGSRRIIKFWGEAVNFLSTTWVIGDYVVMVNTRTHPFYLVEIYDKRMAHDHREVFRNLWPLVE